MTPTLKEGKMTEEAKDQENSGNGTLGADAEYSAAFAEASSQKIAGENPQAIAGEDEETEAQQQEVLQPEDDDDIPDEIKNTQRYKSIFGRIEKERLEKEALKEKLRNYEATQKQRPSFEMAEIPEDMKEDVAEFKKQYPEYADLVELKGREGDRIRSLLSGYGVDIAAVQAENIINRIEVARSKQEVSQQVAQQIAISHEQQIYAAHPDFAELDPEKRLTFLEGIRDWIDEQPMKDARKWERVFNEGTTKETVALFSEFKKHLKKTTATTQSNTKRQQAINDGLAVPASARSASGRFSKAIADPDDYSGAFAEAVRLKRK